MATPENEREGSGGADGTPGRPDYELRYMGTDASDDDGDAGSDGAGQADAPEAERDPRKPVGRDYELRYMGGSSSEQDDDATSE